MLLYLKNMILKESLKLNFYNGGLTTDSRLLLYKVLNNKIGFSHGIINTLNIYDNIKQKTWE